jgi:hypothetical protein
MYSVEYVSEEHMTSILESNKPSKIPTWKQIASRH